MIYVGALHYLPTTGAALSTMTCFQLDYTKEFELQGRVGDWDPARQLGNPMHQHADQRLSPPSL